MSTPDEPRAGAFRGVDYWCDLLCEDCAAFMDDVDTLRQDVAVRLRHFPLVAHVWAVPAAHVAEEAKAQGVLWQVTRAVLGAQDEINGVDDLVRLAQHAGADPTAVRRSLMDERHRSSVANDYVEGRRLGVRGVPTLVVHGGGEPVLLDGRRTREGLVDSALALASARHLADLSTEAGR